ncbi:MAG TPA: NADH-quinone oxidoreductase subunit L [Pirellulales bacterium]|nr:NADH-quinone oxidoreductase subunit L [Pirellulales bacterium]
MFSVEILMVLVPALPLLAALVVGLLGRWLLKEWSHLPVIAALVASFVISLFLLFDVKQRSENPPAGEPVGMAQVYTLWTWADIGDAYDSASGEHAFVIDVTLRSDPLTSIMLAMVTFISSLVAIYSVGYMRGDPGYARFFAFVALFVFSMTMLVSVSNFVLLYVFWEAVGLCSYLLIGFWFEKPAAAAAGKKAFLVNRVGDFGFALGLFLIWTTYGTLNFHDVGATGAPVSVEDGSPADAVKVPGVLGQWRLSRHDYVGGAGGLLICLGLLAGACGKSAQFPLHVWLPDAMEGPTPVSALIHAATMVTAGVYMLARCTPLLVAAPEAQAAVALVGGFTALLAGLIAMTQNDLKRVLAYSTVSQLGYMFLGVGTGTLAGITAGMFHLFTHAFFKGLLFLGAGSVMHAMGGVVDIRRLGGLRRVMPWTHRTFLVGCLALAGVVPFAGFYSKDAILAAVLQQSHVRSRVTLPFCDTAVPLYEALYYAGLFTAFLTAVYTFRAFFLTFHGETRIPPEAGHHAHESPAAMLVPLFVLAICALGVGWYFTEGSDDSFAKFLQRTPSLAYGAPAHAAPHDSSLHSEVETVSTIIALAGIGLAALLYLGDRRLVEGLTRRLKWFYQLSYGKFFIDPLYDLLFVGPLRLLSTMSYWFDRWIVDGLVNLGGRLPADVGSMMRALQNGLIQFYALGMVLGLLTLIGTLLAW